MTLASLLAGLARLNPAQGGPGEPAAPQGHVGGSGLHSRRGGSGESVPHSGWLWVGSGSRGRDGGLARPVPVLPAACVLGEV